MPLNLAGRVHIRHIAGGAIGARVLLRGSGGARQRLVRMAYSFAAGSIAGAALRLLTPAAQAEPAASNPKVTSSLPNGWAAAVDPSSGRTFYYRGSQTTWEKPVADRELPSPTPPSEWEAHLDAGTGRTYYYNASTGETSWSKPNTQDGDEAAQDEGGEQAEDNEQQQPRTNDLLQKLRACHLVNESQRSRLAPDHLFTGPAVGFFLFVPSAEMRVEAQ